MLNLYRECKEEQKIICFLISLKIVRSVVFYQSLILQQQQRDDVQFLVATISNTSDYQIVVSRVTKIAI